LRGTIQGFIGAASKAKWLKVQTGPYFATFFAPDSVAFQRKFFDRYLKGLDNGWEQEPLVDVVVRSPDDKIRRHIHSKTWPLEGTQFVKMHLDASGKTLEWKAPTGVSSATHAALGTGTTLLRRRSIATWRSPGR